MLLATNTIIVVPVIQQYKNYLHSIYAVVDIISNLKIIETYVKIYRGYIQLILSFVTNPSLCQFKCLLNT